MLIPFDTAQAELVAACPVLPPPTLDPPAALGCVTASPGPVLPFDATSMDGYAVCAADIAAAGASGRCRWRYWAPCPRAPPPTVVRRSGVPTMRESAATSPRAML